MLSSFPAGQSALVDPQSSGQFLLGQALETAEGDYSLAKSLGLGIIGRVAQELDDPRHEAEGGG